MSQTDTSDVYRCAQRKRVSVSQQHCEGNCGPCLRHCGSGCVQRQTTVVEVSLCDAVRAVSAAAEGRSINRATFCFSKNWDPIQD